MSPMTNSSSRKRHAENTPRIYPGDVIDVDGRIIRIPKETPVTKHPETTTEWLEDIALELHAITGLLNERLPVVHPGGQSNELNNDDPDEALAAAMWDARSALSFSAAHASVRADYIRMARAAREHIEAERPPETDWEGLFGVEQRKREKAEADRDEWKARAERFAAAMRTEIKGHDATQARVDRLTAELATAHTERDEWQSKFERADNLYSRARDERDHFRGACNSWQSVAQEAEYLSEKFRAERDEYADRAERWEARHAALREDVDREYRRTDYPPAHIALKDILDRDAQRGEQS